MKLHPFFYAVAAALAIVVAPCIVQSCHNHTPGDRLHFDVQPLGGDRVRITALPDGNTWETTRDSVGIWIDNY